uniref:Putative secreted protein n=1 Tax=Anopheles darlingi TaxID=43151 RepID=A0A2M4DK13_ANODA
MQRRKAAAGHFTHTNSRASWFFFLLLSCGAVASALLPFAPFSSHSTHTRTHTQHTTHNIQHTLQRIKCFFCFFASLSGPCLSHFERVPLFILLLTTAPPSRHHRHTH